MAFAAFEDAPNGTDPFAGNEDADPAADFLARQQNQLADLESNGTYQENNDTGTASNNNSFHRSYSPTEPPANGTSADYSEYDAEASATNGGSATNDLYSAINREDRMQREPEKIKRWRETFVQRITDKDGVEEKKRVELREAAAKELVDWQRHYEEQMERQRATNREAEVAFVKQRDETTPGSEWERVCWLCDFNPKTSKQVKDVSRMRSLLLQLKQQQAPVQQ